MIRLAVAGFRLPREGKKRGVCEGDGEVGSEVVGVGEGGEFLVLEDLVLSDVS